MVPADGSSTTPPGSAGKPPRSASGGIPLPTLPSPDAAFRPDLFRQVLGHFCHFCTGVTVITTAGPAGFACQAFAALSLAPPLVLFCPSRASATWPVIERAGHFCANVLADGQQELASVFGTSGAGKFDGVPWSPSPAGAPILDGTLTWVECAVEAVHEAGDHYLVVGRPGRGRRHAARLAAARRLDVIRARPGGGGDAPGAQYSVSMAASAVC